MAAVAIGVANRAQDLVEARGHLVRREATRETGCRNVMYLLRDRIPIVARQPCLVGPDQARPDIDRRLRPGCDSHTHLDGITLGAERTCFEVENDQRKFHGLPASLRATSIIAHVSRSQYARKLIPAPVCSWRPCRDGWPQGRLLRWR